MMTGMEQFAAANRALLETAQTVNAKALEGVEKLVALQIQAAKAAMNESAEHVKALMETDEPAKLAERNMAFVQPAGDKVAAYAKHMYDIAAETNAGMAEALQKHFDQAQGQYSEWLDAAMKGAPAGSEPLVAAARNAIGMAQGAYDQAMTASRRIAEYAEQNIPGATKASTTPRGAKKA